MAAIVNQIVDPVSFMAVFAVTEVVVLLSEQVVKEGWPMARKIAHSLKTRAIAAWDAVALSGVTPLMSP